MEIVTQNNKNIQETPPKKSSSPFEIARKKFIKNKLAMISLFFLLIVSIVSILAPFITTADITRINIGQMSLEPSADHWLGTDKAGRDVFTRLLYGGRISLLVGISCTLFVIILGTVIGSISGYFGGTVDSLLMRFTDFILNFPFLVFVIVLNAILFGKVNGLWVLIGTISMLSWGGLRGLSVVKSLLKKKMNI